MVELDPRRPWRIGAVIAVLWAASLAGTYLWVRSTVVPQYASATAELANLRAQLSAAQVQIDVLQRQVAQHVRGEQVAERATQELQTALGARQEEIASLRNDLSFYQRLMEGGAQQPGVSVHSLSVRSTDDARAFQYALTLSQNLKRNRQASGKVEISISGASGQNNTRLDLSELGGASSTLQFSFKYFQQVAGLFMFPEGFKPASVKIRVLPEGSAPIEREFIWKDIVNQGDK
jgi:hypothetical protein